MYKVYHFVDFQLIQMLSLWSRSNYSIKISFGRIVQSHRDTYIILHQHMKPNLVGTRQASQRPADSSALKRKFEKWKNRIYMGIFGILIQNLKSLSQLLSSGSKSLLSTFSFGATLTSWEVNARCYRDK